MAAIGAEQVRGLNRGLAGITYGRLSGCSSGSLFSQLMFGIIWVLTGDGA